MSAHPQRTFGKPSAPRTIIIARGDDLRHFTLRPWLTTACATVFAMAVLSAGAGLFVSSGSMGASAAAGSTDDLRVSYESRIASLRSEVERLTSRSFVDREKVASKVDLLLDQQARLAERYKSLQPLLEEARSSGLMTPGETGSRTDMPSSSVGATAFAIDAKPAALDRFRLVDRSGVGPIGGSVGTRDIAPELLQAMARAMDETELEQISGLNALVTNARSRTAAIDAILKSEGLHAKASPHAAADGEGGPLVPVPSDRRFDEALQNLASALDGLRETRKSSAALPLRTPLALRAVSSPFGVRSDPFLDRAAMHTGIDFVAEPGSDVRATADGVVSFAGENGAYGRMVEVDHGNGLTSRYAHMSAIAVSLGDRLKAGRIVGQVGSTGRSTGPHLHYELRQAGEAVDPERFLRAGRRISTLG